MRVEAVRQVFENKSFKKKLIAGAGLAGGDWVVSRYIDGLSLAGVASGVMEPLIRNHPMWVLGLMASVFTVAAGVNAAQSMRLLKDKEVGVSPNWLATGAFHVVDKKLPLKRRLLRKLSMGAIGAGQVVSKEHFAIAPAVFGNEMALAWVVTNGALKIPFNLAKAVVSEVVLRAKKEKRIKKSRNTDLRDAGVIFKAPVPVAMGD